MPKQTHNNSSSSRKRSIINVGLVSLKFLGPSEKNFKCQSLLIALYLILEILKPNMEAIFYVVAQRGLINICNENGILVITSLYQIFT